MSFELVLPISIFNTDYGLIDPNASQPDITLKFQNREVSFREMKAGYEFEMNTDTNMFYADVIVKRNQSEFIAEKVQIDPGKKSMLLNTFVLEKYTFFVDFPYDFRDTDSDYPNFKLFLSDRMGNILFEGYTYDLDKNSTVNLYNKVVNNEFLTFKVFYERGYDSLEEIYALDFKVFSKEKKVFAIRTGLIPYCEFHLLDAAGKGLIAEYPVYWITLSDDFKKIHKFLSASPDFKTIRFISPPFLSNKKVMMTLMMKKTAEADPEMLLKKRIYISKRLGNKKIKSYNNTRIFKKLVITNFNSLKNTFIGTNCFFMEVEYGKNRKIIPFGELTEEIILLDYRSNLPVNIRVIRKTGNKSELLYLLEDYKNNNLIIPVFPQKESTIIELCGIVAAFSGEDFSISIYNGSGHLVKLIKRLQVFTTRYINIPGGKFVTGEKLKLKINTRKGMMFETTVKSGKKNKVFIPVKKAITLAVAPYLQHGEIHISGKIKKIENGICFINESDIDDQNKISISLNDSVIEKYVDENPIFVNFQTLDIILPILKLDRSGILDLSITDLKAVSGDQMVVKLNISGNGNSFFLSKNKTTDHLVITVPDFGNVKSYSERFRIITAPDNNGSVEVTIMKNKKVVTQILKKLQDITEK